MELPRGWRVLTTAALIAAVGAGSYLGLRQLLTKLRTDHGLECLRQRLNSALDEPLQLKTTDLGKEYRNTTVQVLVGMDDSRKPPVIRTITIAYHGDEFSLVDKTKQAGTIVLIFDAAGGLLTAHVDSCGVLPQGGWIEDVKPDVNRLREAIVKAP